MSTTEPETSDTTEPGSPTAQSPPEAHKARLRHRRGSDLEIPGYAAPLLPLADASDEVKPSRPIVRRNSEDELQPIDHLEEVAIIDHEEKHNTAKEDQQEASKLVERRVETALRTMQVIVRVLAPHVAAVWKANEENSCWSNHSTTNTAAATLLRRLRSSHIFSVGVRLLLL